MGIAQTEADLAEDVRGELLLSVVLLEGLLPVGGGELEHLINGPARQETEKVAQVSPGLDVVKLAAREERDERGVGVAAVVTADKQPILATEGLASQGAFRKEEMIADDLLESDIAMATAGAELVEDYPTAFPFPACLLLGWVAPDAPIHMVWAFDAATDYAVLVTVYRPDPARWSADFRQRVKR